MILHCNYSYAMNRIVDNTTQKNKILTLKSMYHYYDCNRQISRRINFKNTVSYIDYSLINASKSQNIITPGVNFKKPTKPSILKLKNGDLALFIPYTSLIMLPKVS